MFISAPFNSECFTPRLSPNSSILVWSKVICMHVLSLGVRLLSDLLAGNVCGATWGEVEWSV